VEDIADPVPRCLVSPSSEELLAGQAERPVALVPIRVEFETDSHRVRDCFVWNLHEALVTPEEFARELKKRDVKAELRVMKPGETISLPD